jgi:hypothetical protein
VTRIEKKATKVSFKEEKQPSENVINGTTRPNPVIHPGRYLESGVIPVDKLYPSRVIYV